MSAPPRSRPAVAPPDGTTVRPDRVYLGWHYAPRHTDPRPLPRGPAPPAPEQLNQGWVDAQRREENRLDRPLKLACGAALALFGVVTGLGGARPVELLVTRGLGRAGRGRGGGQRAPDPAGGAGAARADRRGAAAGGQDQGRAAEPAGRA